MVTACTPKDDEYGITREMIELQNNLNANAEAKLYFETSIPRPGSLCLSKNQAGYTATIAKWLRTHKNVSLILEGHCDERGATEYNLALGERRALAVKQAIVYEYKKLYNEELDPTRIDVISFGKENNPEPYVQGADRNAYLAKNRVVISKIKDA